MSGEDMRWDFTQQLLPTARNRHVKQCSEALQAGIRRRQQIASDI